MNLPVLLKSTALAGSLFLLGTGLKAQGCINDLQYPSNTILPDPLGAVTSIDNCSYFGDYSVVGPAVAGGSYTFAVETGGYVTVREGAVDGTVIAQGNSPLVATATVAGDLYVHWNADSLCATSTGCLVTTVQFMLDCTPPVATVVAVDDCDNNQFSITVNVTSIGDGTSVDLIYSVDGGADQTMSAPETGSYNIGPFTVGQVVNLTVAHSSDPLCNIHFNGLVSGNTCATIIQCGGAPLDETYCYVNSDNNHWHWQSSGGEALIAIFSAGMIESATYDHLRIYDGPDNTGTLLYDHTMLATEDLAGLQVVAPSGEMYMENSSDGSVSCATNTAWEWAWQVGCLDCTPATATYTVITDCDNFQFSVEVHITDLGSDGTLDISVDSLGTVLATATDTGVYTVGPFTANIPVVITLANSDNSLCNVHSTALVNPLCPQIIQCGDPAIT
ncbi:MAG TPA: hypothetical protein PLZ24_15415, partial [Flavobacteriales bacterium]|nr:hypothetical protein [Flavobacteriales bacterium]